MKCIIPTKLIVLACKSRISNFFKDINERDGTITIIV